MIDNPIAATELFEQIETALPLPARLTPELRASLAQQEAGAPVPADCTVIGLHYMGDEGGIVCKLDLGASVQNLAFVSITHLRFDPPAAIEPKDHRLPEAQGQTAPAAGALTLSHLQGSTKC